MRHIPVEGIVLGFLHAHAAGSLISLRRAVGGRLHLYRLPVLYRRIITMFVGAATTTTDALPSLCWRMLCRSNSLGLMDALPSRLCCLLVVSGGCFAAVVLLLVDTWPPSGCFVVSVSSLGDVILCVGSTVFRSLGWSW